MDSLTDRSFMDLFGRVSEYLDFEACETPEDIEWEMIYAIAFMRRIARKAKKESTKKKWYGRAKLLRIIGRDGVPATSKKLKGKIRMGFARRVIQYAEAHPRSRLALTMKYGKKEAQKILRKRLLKRLETMSKKRK